MQTGAVRERLLADRRMPEKPNGNGAVPVGREILTGKKLAEAASYLKSARAALIGWTREVYANSDALEMHLVHVRETLGLAERMENEQAKLEGRARIFGV